MARRSLRPHLNQIRTWVRQGRTDAWIAHQLEVTVQQIETFKRENDLAPDSPDNGDVPAGVDFDDEIDLRAEDDALIAAELEAAEAARRAEQERREAEDAARREAEAEARAAAGDDDDEETGVDAESPKPRRRGRRGGRGRRRTEGGRELEGTFDHGEEGYGLWLDPAVADNPVYAEHWAGHRAVTVTIDEDQIVIRRAGEDDDGDGDD
jgi:DNA-binding protein H-NS